MVSGVAVAEVDKAVTRVSSTNRVNGYVNFFYFVEAISGKQSLDFVWFGCVRDVSCVA